MLELQVMQSGYQRHIHAFIFKLYKNKIYGIRIKTMTDTADKNICNMPEF